MILLYLLKISSFLLCCRINFCWSVFFCLLNFLISIRNNLFIIRSEKQNVNYDVMQVNGGDMLLKHCIDRTSIIMRNTYILHKHKLMKVLLLTKLMRIVTVICSQLSLKNTSCIIFDALSHFL